MLVQTAWIDASRRSCSSHGEEGGEHARSLHGGPWLCFVGVGLYNDAFILAVTHVVSHVDGLVRWAEVPCCPSARPRGAALTLESVENFRHAIRKLEGVSNAIAWTRALGSFFVGEDVPQVEPVADLVCEGTTGATLESPGDSGKGINFNDTAVCRVVRLAQPRSWGAAAVCALCTCGVIDRPYDPDVNFVVSAISVLLFDSLRIGLIGCRGFRIVSHQVLGKSPKFFSNVVIHGCKEEADTERLKCLIGQCELLHQDLRSHNATGCDVCREDSKVDGYLDFLGYTEWQGNILWRLL